jgi:CO/xanthine dehydrogenase FAD-binding subunit
MTVATYFLPESLPEAIDLLQHHGRRLLVMAGGTVTMPLVNEGISQPELVMGLRRVGLDALRVTGGTLRIGATTTLTALAEQADVPLLAEAARHTASWTIRNLATVGGNLFTPPPGGDVAVALLALDATVTLAGPQGERTLPLADFWTGFMTTALAADELLTAISVPLSAGPGGRAVFHKFGRKHANTPAVVTVAARIAWDGDRVADARITLGAVGPHPLRARAAEAAILGTALEPDAIAAAAAAATNEIEPFTDAVATDWYRRRVTGVIVGRALDELAGRSAQGGR